MSQCVAYCGGMDPKDFSVTTKLFPEAKRDAYQNYDKNTNGEFSRASIPYEFVNVVKQYRHEQYVEKIGHSE